MKLKRYTEFLTEDRNDDQTAIAKDIHFIMKLAGDSTNNELTKEVHRIFMDKQGVRRSIDIDYTELYDLPVEELKELKNTALIILSKDEKLLNYYNSKTSMYKFNI